MQVLASLINDYNARQKRDLQLKSVFNALSELMGGSSDSSNTPSSHLLLQTISVIAAAIMPSALSDTDRWKGTLPQLQQLLTLLGAVDTAGAEAAGGNCCTTAPASPTVAAGVSGSGQQRSGQQCAAFRALSQQERDLYIQQLQEAQQLSEQGRVHAAQLEVKIAHNTAELLQKDLEVDKLQMLHAAQLTELQAESKYAAEQHKKQLQEEQQRAEKLEKLAAKAEGRRDEARQLRQQLAATGAQAKQADAKLKMAQDALAAAEARATEAEQRGADAERARAAAEQRAAAAQQQDATDAVRQIITAAEQEVAAAKQQAEEAEQRAAAAEKQVAAAKEQIAAAEARATAAEAQAAAAGQQATEQAATATAKAAGERQVQELQRQLAAAQAETMAQKARHLAADAHAQAAQQGWLASQGQLAQLAQSYAGMLPHFLTGMHVVAGAAGLLPAASPSVQPAGPSQPGSGMASLLQQLTVPQQQLLEQLLQHPQQQQQQQQQRQQQPSPPQQRAP